MAERAHPSRLLAESLPFVQENIPLVQGGTSNSIWLVGYRGTGKTTVAQVLATRLGWSWIDMDSEIERRAGKSIASMFADEGERYFRDRERETLAELILRDRVVVATGGGVVTGVENRRLLARVEMVVWLRAKPETILARITTDKTSGSRRPNLTPRGGIEEIQTLLGERAGWYAETARIAIDTDGITPDDIARTILSHWGPHPA